MDDIIIRYIIQIRLKNILGLVIESFGPISCGQICIRMCGFDFFLYMKLEIVYSFIPFFCDGIKPSLCPAGKLIVWIKLC
jgi:hypothetical protein